MQDPWLRSLFGLLATWRVAHLLAYEDGPGDVFVRLRAKLGGGFLGRLVDCFQCNSLWVSALFALAVSHSMVDWAVAWLGLSGGACLIEKLVREPLDIRPLATTEVDDALLREQTDLVR